MKTYQDFLAVGKDDKARMSFILGAINEYKADHSTRLAANANKYYHGENPTINKYEKIIYDMQGKAHRDMYTANHKIASKFFGLVVDQEVSYLLGNGISFQKPETEKALGTSLTVTQSI